MPAPLSERLWPAQQGASRKGRGKAGLARAPAGRPPQTEKRAAADPGLDGANGKGVYFFCMEIDENARRRPGKRGADAKGRKNMLDIQKEIGEGRAVFALKGRLDTNTASKLERELKEVYPELKELVLDFAALDYISSAGLRVLLTAHKTMMKQGEMRLEHVNENIQEIFEVTGFTDILTIV